MTAAAAGGAGGDAREDRSVKPAPSFVTIRLIQRRRVRVTHTRLLHARAQRALRVPERLFDRLELGLSEPAGGERAGVDPAGLNLAVDGLTLGRGDRAVVDELWMAFKNGCWLTAGFGASVLSGTGDVGAFIAAPLATAAWPCVLARGFAARAAVPAIAPTTASAASAPVAV